MTTSTYTKIDRVSSILLGLCVLILMVYNFTTCTEPEPAFVQQQEQPPPLDTISDWDIFYFALVQVESGGRADVVGKTNDAGVIQITPIYVKEANRIVGESRYTLECRFSPELSREMFDVIQSHRNPDCDIERAIKLHNPRAGKEYRARIINEFNKLKYGNQI